MKLSTLGNSIFYLVILGLIVWGAIGYLKNIGSAKNWITTTGTYISSEVFVEAMQEPYGMTYTGDYVVTVTYEYTDPIDKHKKRANTILAGGTYLGHQVPLAMPKEPAERLAARFKQQGTFPVYINSNNPNQTGIIKIDELYAHYKTYKPNPILRFLVITLLLFVLGAGLYVGYLVKFKPDVLQRYCERFTRH